MEYSDNPRAVYMRRWLAENPEKREAKNERDRQYYQENADEIKAYQLSYYERNRDKVLKREIDRNRDNKIRAVMVLGGKCMRCGFDKHPAALQFYHRDPSQKRFTITAKTIAATKQRPWEMVLEEIAKCDLVCANCHFMLESSYDLDGFWPGVV